MQLAEKLAHLKSENPIIYALPRGGVPVAFEVKIFPFKQLEQDWGISILVIKMKKNTIYDRMYHGVENYI